MLRSATTDYGSLLRATVSAIDKFDPNRLTVDGYLDDYCEEVKRAKNEVEEKFIRQCVYGCVRYQKFLRIFVTAFLEFRPAVTQRGEQTLYMVLAYLIFPALEGAYGTRARKVNDVLLSVLRSVAFTSIRCNDESSFWPGASGSGFKCGFGEFLDTCSPPTMLALLEFAFDRSAVESWVYTEWAKIYDERFIEESILKPIEDLRHECDTLLNAVSRKATGTDAKVDHSLPPIKPRIKHTVPSPFQLTEPKPRQLPVPRETIKPVTSRPVPESLSANSLRKIKEQDEARLLMTKEKTQSKYGEDTVPTLVTAGRAADIDSLRKEMEDKRFAECTFQPSPAKPVPKVLPESEVKATSASLLRQYLTELRDASEFHDWQNRMYAQDELDEKLRLERRKLEMHLAREQAAEASKAHHRRNNVLASIQKETVREKLEETEREIEEALERKRDLVSVVQSERDNPREAERRVIESKVMEAERVREEKAKEFERKRLEDEYEMERRRDIIMQIRALERVSVVKTIPYDPSEIPHHGLLEEMSLAELKERLKLAKEADEAERENRRAHNLEQKRIKHESLLAKAEQLSTVRQQARIEAEERHRKEAQMKAEELREITKKRAALAESAELLARKRHEELHKGRKRIADFSSTREASHRQKTVLNDKSREMKVLARSKAIREANVARSQAETEELRKKYDVAMDQARAEDDYRRSVTRRAVKGAHAMQRAQEGALSRLKAEAMPYTAKANSRSIENARSLAFQPRKHAHGC
ncbi:hypothetical protein FOZ60_003547 [Perkinsus olseni]|uniref:Uncharacterized protein n=1 Tax=Perkinsus olseni TaxID=32597 RepID=A0A7J6NV63_PEROL|nr:hypothetical protein FOZ60_003547 [Perkinsus olseni]